jgi:hypothetical protein
LNSLFNVVYIGRVLVFSMIRTAGDIIYLQVFDEDIRSFVYSLEGSADKTRMQLPNDPKRGCK